MVENKTTDYTKEQWLAKIGETKDLAAVKALASEAYQNENYDGFNLRDDDAVQVLVDKFKEIISESTEIAAFTKINVMQQDPKGFYGFTTMDQDNEIIEAMCVTFKSVIPAAKDPESIKTVYGIIYFYDFDDTEITNAFSAQVKTVISETTDTVALTALKEVIDDVGDNDLLTAFISQLTTIIETKDSSVLATDDFKKIIEDIDDDDLVEAYESKINT